MIGYREDEYKHTTQNKCCSTKHMKLETRFVERVCENCKNLLLNCEKVGFVELILESWSLQTDHNGIVSFHIAIWWQHWMEYVFLPENFSKFPTID